MSDQIHQLIAAEEARQIAKIGLIPSENHASPAVAQALSSCLASKYAEGYPGRRYYEGNQIADQIEDLTRERIKKLFKVPAVNVQPYSGSPANSEIYFALMNPGDTLLGLALASGGHLTHGHPQVTFSGRYFKSVQYGLNDQARVDFDQVRALAQQHHPKVIVAGNTAYPFELDFQRFAQIADEVGAWLVADISHITGLVISGGHQSPVPFAHLVMSTTHKTFRGPRGAMILVTDKGLAKDPDLAKKIDQAVFPGLQGGPHLETVAAIGIAAAEASTPNFVRYGQQIKANAQELATKLQQHGLKLVGDGTETHLMLIDLTPFSPGLGTQVAIALDAAGIYANKNTIPGEPCSPFYPSGLRIGTPLVTTRGMKEPEMAKIASWIAQVIQLVKGKTLPTDKKARSPFIKEFRIWANQDPKLAAIKDEVAAFASRYPLFAS